MFESSVTFIRACKEMGLKLATASSSNNARHILEIAGLADLFDTIVCGRDAARGKPNPDIFLLAAERIGLPASACVVLEDASSGVRAAKAGGFYCIGVDRAGQPERLAGADRIVSDLMELAPSTLIA